MAMSQDIQVTDTEKKIAAHISEIIKLLGEDVNRQGLVRTPLRAARALYYATRGYRQDPDTIINQAIFDHDGSRMVIVRDIEFYSLCEHHILPFYGHISIGYIPHGNTIGLSKLARIVDFYARRLQVQERLTSEICRLVADKLGALGVIVQCEAHHLCMKMRGVEKQDSTTVTVEVDGLFADSEELRNDFYRALNR